MRFRNFIREETIQAELTADTKDDVIRELVEQLVAAGRIEPHHSDEIVGLVMERERLGSTGIGRGIGIPHTKHSAVAHPVAAVGVSEQGIDFDSLDRERTHVFFLLVSPPGHAREHLQALENIARQLHDDMFCRLLKQSRTGAAVMELLYEADENEQPLLQEA